MVTIYIKGKEAISFKDIVFFLAGFFVIGFVVGISKYTGDTTLILYLVPPVFIMLVIYTVNLMKVYKEEVKENNPSTSAVSPTSKSIKAPKTRFFEA